jgi:hypothetical protein
MDECAVPWPRPKHRRRRRLHLATAKQFHERTPASEEIWRLDQESRQRQKLIRERIDSMRQHEEEEKKIKADAERATTTGSADDNPRNEEKDVPPRKQPRRLPAFMLRRKEEEEEDNRPGSCPHVSEEQVRAEVRDQLRKRVAQNETVAHKTFLRRAAQSTQRAQERTQVRARQVADKIRRAEAEREAEERRLSGELAPHVRRMILDYVRDQTPK